MEIAEGEYIHFLDSDDYYKDEYSLEIMLENAERYKSDILLFPYEMFDRNFNSFKGPKTKEEITFWKSNENVNSIQIELYDQTGLLALPAYPWNKLYSRDFLIKNEIKFSETKVHNDLFFVWKSFLSAKTLGLFTKPLIVHSYSEKDNQLTNDKSRKRFDLFKTLLETEEFVMKQNNKAKIIPWFSKFKIDCLCFGLGKIDRKYRSEYSLRCKTILKNDKLKYLYEIKKRMPVWYRSLIKFIMIKHLPNILFYSFRLYRRIKKGQ